MKKPLSDWYQHISQAIASVEGATYPLSILSQNKTKLVSVIVLTILYMLVEVAGGVLSGSLALVTDAVHMLSHVGTLTMTFFAITFASKPPTREKSFGYYRLEVLAAFLNGIVLILLDVYIFSQVYKRLLSPPGVQGSLMIVVALVGLVLNSFGVKLLHHPSKESLVFRSVFLQVLLGVLGSVGVIVAGVVVSLTEWRIADPIASALIGFVMVPNIYKLIRGSVDVLLESAPKHISPESVEKALLGIDGVKGVYHLHLWTITSGIYAATVHLTIDRTKEWDEIREKAGMILRKEFKMAHSTVQIEDEETHIRLHLKKDIERADE
jgi:cobalt-zinc-cadmium efflux system protein